MCCSIVGVGNNSKGGVQRIRPAVEELCHELNLPVVPEQNPGRVYISLAAAQPAFILQTLMKQQQRTSSDGSSLLIPIGLPASNAVLWEPSHVVPQRCQTSEPMWVWLQDYYLPGLPVVANAVPWAPSCVSPVPSHIPEPVRQAHILSQGYDHPSPPRLANAFPLAPSRVVPVLSHTPEPLRQAHASPPGLPNASPLVPSLVTPVRSHTPEPVRQTNVSSKDLPNKIGRASCRERVCNGV